MIPIGLQYSTDNASTWSAALEFDVFTLRVSEAGDGNNLVIGKTGKRFPRGRAYLVVEFMTEMDFFDPSDAVHTATANANWAALEAILEPGNLIRFYNDDTTNFPNLDGHTEFNSTSNTNYLLMESYTPIFHNMDGIGATGKKRRQMEVRLMTQAKI